MATFREDFIELFYSHLEKNTHFVSPTEIGVLRARYMRIYENTEPRLRLHVLEQLFLSLQMYVTLCQELAPRDGLKFTKMLNKLNVDMTAQFDELKAAFVIKKQ